MKYTWMYVNRSLCDLQITVQSQYMNTEWCSVVWFNSIALTGLVYMMILVAFLYFLQSKSKYSELQHMSSSGDRVHGNTNFVEYSAVGPKVGNYMCVKLLACVHNRVLDMMD